MKSKSQLGVNPQTKREDNDFYATNPMALNLFLKSIDFKLNINLWECACGEGHLSKELEKEGFKVKSSDKINRGFGEVNDFLEINDKFEGDIITNPPFKLAEEFVEKGMQLIEVGNKLILFQKIQFLEGQRRNKLFKKYPLKYVYVHSSRQQCSRNADFEKYKLTTQFYAWYVWEKGFEGNTILKWISSESN